MSYLPGFIDLTFQVPMQYCSLQHQTLLLPPDISTTEHCFYIGPATSFFLELFLHWSPVAYWAPTDLGSFSFSVIIFLTFHTVYGVLKVRMLKWFAIPFYSGPHFLRTLHHDPYVYWMGSKERRDLLLYLLHPLFFSLYKRESLAIYHGSFWVTKWWLWTAIESIWLRYTLWMILPFLP